MQKKIQCKVHWKQHWKSPRITVRTNIDSALAINTRVGWETGALLRLRHAYVQSSFTELKPS